MGFYIFRPPPLSERVSRWKPNDHRTDFCRLGAQRKSGQGRLSLDFKHTRRQANDWARS